MKFFPTKRVGVNLVAGESNQVVGVYAKGVLTLVPGCSLRTINKVLHASAHFLKGSGTTVEFREPPAHNSGHIKLLVTAQATQKRNYNYYSELM